MASEDPDRPGPDPDEPLGLTLERRPREERPPGRRWAWPLAALAGVAVVAVAGVIFVAAEQANRRDEAAVRTAGPQLQVDASALPPAPLPQAALDAPKLQVLPDLPPTPVAPPATDFDDPTKEPAVPQIVEPAPPREPAPSANAAGRDSNPPDCRDAQSRAAAMVCADPDLAAADRRMRAAYVDALRAGAPPDLLGRDQDAWLAAREEAAQWSRSALAEAYRRRIAELRDIAENGW
jgi:uncharacterized protein YecT (DUF1311 family)